MPVTSANVHRRTQDLMFVLSGMREVCSDRILFSLSFAFEFTFDIAWPFIDPLFSSGVHLELISAVTIYTSIRGHLRGSSSYELALRKQLLLRTPGTLNTTLIRN